MFTVHEMWWQHPFWRKKLLPVTVTVQTMNSKKMVVLINFVQQEAQLSQIGRAQISRTMLHVTEYFAKSLKVIQNNTLA